ncbi:choline/ethanolamine kinase family protein [Magnetospira sp. QH-2]|uniref:choline/ethanolamine kinase family protein n=1 Tax=Magnetospira sp. (strain QH-2) TaxID=1288970 RepID=UPI0003E8112B|nr:choline/ethanolamine kinase family protein [Magnetospira sp. QH-2]CCQ72678.1 putative kinase [Magnetospira sp. QH-2]
MTAPAPEEWIRLHQALQAAGFAVPPQFSDARRLGGGEHNPVFGLRWDSKRVVVRLAEPARNQRIDRTRELANAEAAASCAVGPKVLYASAADGTMVTPWIDGMIPGEDDFRDPDLIGKAAAVLRRLHCSAATFSGELPPLVFLDNQERRIQKRNLDIPDDLRSLTPHLRTMRSWVDTHPGQSAPCHLDPIAANMVDTGQRIVLLDWEYSAVCDPIWDLANLGARNDFTADDDAVLIKSYCQEASPPEIWRRYLFFKALCALNWALVYLLQESDGMEPDGPRHTSPWWIKTIGQAVESALSKGFLPHGIGAPTP